MNIRDPWIVTAQCPHTGAVKRVEVSAMTARQAVETAIAGWLQEDPEDDGVYEFTAYHPGDYAAAPYPLCSLICVRGGEAWPIAGLFTSPKAALRHVESIEATDDLTSLNPPTLTCSPPTDFGHGRRWTVSVDQPDDDGAFRYYTITEHKGTQP